MSKRSGFAAILLLLAILMVRPVKADASWVQNSIGTYTYYNNSGKKLTSQWFAQEKVGFVKKGSATYCYKLDGSIYKGWLTVDSKTYYLDRNGKLLKSKWILSKGKKYYASKKGPIYKNCIVKIGKNYFGFDTNGAMLKGKAQVKGKTYYFSKKTGYMMRKVFVTLDGKKYYFSSNGVLGSKVWVNNYYINASGYIEKNAWVGDRYVGEDGRPLKGLQLLNGTYYYFGSNNKKIASTTKTLSGVKYTFDAEGKGTTEAKTNETQKPSVSVQSTYYTDPVVSDETLLAAIIYCEAGNQPYYGQVAVGMVITNRMRSSAFPSKLKEVVYQSIQFSPTFDGSLTTVLKNQSKINVSCKKAAAEVLQKYKANQYTIEVDGKGLNFKSYLFFMTKSAYQSLGFSVEYKQLGDHVFLKKWK